MLPARHEGMSAILNVGDSCNSSLRTVEAAPPALAAMTVRLRRCRRPGEAMKVLAELWPAAEAALPAGMRPEPEWFCGHGGRIFLPVLAKYVLGCDRSTLTRAMSELTPAVYRLRCRQDSPRRKYVTADEVRRQRDVASH